MSERANPERWTEAMLEALEPHEHDFQEFKGSSWVLAEDGAVQPHFLVALSKQVSAFVNGAGGRVFIGLDDRGRVDGGLPVNLKSGARAWLEDIVPSCVDPPLRKCNVFEIQGDSSSTRIRPGCAVYVLDLPSSENAPHQSKDNRYYLRIAGKSRPMGTVHVNDVLRRTRHPQLTLSRLGPFGDAELVTTDPRGPVALVQLRAFLTNTGRTLAHHVGVELVVPRPFAGSEVRRRMRETGETVYSHTPGEVTFFRYHPTPVFPTQEVYAISAWVSLHQNNLALARGGASISWVIYADDAEPVRGSRELRSFQVVLKGTSWLAAPEPGPVGSP
jgi:Putative DNA-binding domain